MNKNFTLVLIGQIISLFGSAIQRVALSLYLLQLTGSAAVYGNIVALSILPYIFAAPYAGMIADTYSRKYIMIILDVLASIVMVVFGVSLWLNVAGVKVSAIVMLLLSFIATCYQPAVQACIPDIVEKQYLPKANSYISQVQAFCNIAAPVLAGVLYGFLGIGAIVVINIVSFLFSAVLECFIDLPKQAKTSQSVGFISSIKHMKQTYYKVSKSYRSVAGIIISYGLFNICIVPLTTIFFPAVLNLQLQVSSQVYGIVEGIMTCGMFISGVLLLKKASWFSFEKVYRWDYLLPFTILLMMCIFVFTSSYYVRLLAVTVGGFVIMFTLGVGNIVTLSHIQHVIPISMLGSVSALSTAIATATVPVGQMLFGNLMEYISTSVLLGICAIVSYGVCRYMKKVCNRV